MVFFRIFFILLLPVVAFADADTIELKITDMETHVSKNGAATVRFLVPLVSPHKGRLHKIKCRLDTLPWNKVDKPVDDLSFVMFEGSKKQKTYELTAPPQYAGKRLNVYCQAQPRV